MAIHGDEQNRALQVIRQHIELQDKKADPCIFLLFGPAGTGKSHFVRVIKENSQSILFIDEADALLRHIRGTDSGTTARVKQILLKRLSGPDSVPGLTVILATNNPEEMDMAFRSR